MFRKTHLFACLAILLVLTACGPAGVTLTASDSGGQIEVQTGDLIVIQLEGNPSTGYTWGPRDLDTSMFEMVGEPEFKSDNPDLVGSGGTLTLTFKTLKAGTATLNLVYHRPWETDVEPLDTFSITITVE